MKRISIFWSRTDGASRLNLLAAGLLMLGIMLGTITGSSRPARATGLPGSRLHAVVTAALGNMPADTTAPMKMGAASPSPLGKTPEGENPSPPTNNSGDEEPPPPVIKDVPGQAGLKGTPAPNQGQIDAAVSSSDVALQLHVTLLELGKQRLANIPDYTATFLKQERLDGSGLTDLQTMSLKMRHKPHSVYLKWQEGGDKGREVLYVEGENDNKMLVKLGGLKGRLLPHLKLDPSGSIAMAEARHPVTEMGLMQLCDVLLKYRKRDLQLPRGQVNWRLMPAESVFERDCYCFVIEYQSPAVEPVYRKSVVYIDRELALPVCVKNFGWPADGEEVCTDPEVFDEETLIEYYGYVDIRLATQLADIDFDKGNTEYLFRR